MFPRVDTHRTRWVSPTAMKPQLLVITAFMLVAGCASLPDTMGMRSDFDEHRIERITVLPTYSTSSFGMNDSEARYLCGLFEKEATSWLQSHAVDVVPSQEFMTQLRRANALDTLTDGYPPDIPLYKLFEPSEQTFESAERTAVKTLSRKKLLTSDTLLALEVVYHSEGDCYESAADHVDRVWVSGNASSSACVVTHLRAKLVHAETAETMWQNRALVEHRGDINPASRITTIANVVRLTLGGEDGLEPYLKGGSAKPSPP